MKNTGFSELLSFFDNLSHGEAPRALRSSMASLCLLLQSQEKGQLLFSARKNGKGEGSGQQRGKVTCLRLRSSQWQKEELNLPLWA